MVIASAAIVLALIAGLLCNRFLRRRAGDEDSPSITDLISPLETLAVLVLAFVLVGAAESYGSAEDAVAAEAATVDHLFETADYAPEPYREPLQAAAVCYAKAVKHHAWPAMQNGTGTSAPSVWTTELRTHFKQMSAAGHDGSVFETLVSTDRDRSQARQSRISESTPAIPDIVYWFMALTLAITIAGYAYSIRLRQGRAHILAVIMLTALFVSSLLIIRDVDTPYSGPIRIEPTEIVHTEQDITEDFTAEYGPDRLPCDEQGAPKHT